MSSSTQPLKPESIKYVVFEGGGGKGLAYLGALRALKDRFKNFVNGAPAGQITGVGGASAGAITAFLVACRFPIDSKTTGAAGDDRMNISYYAHAIKFSNLLNVITPGLQRMVDSQGTPTVTAGGKKTSLLNDEPLTITPSGVPVITAAQSAGFAKDIKSFAALLALRSFVSEKKNTSSDGSDARSAGINSVLFKILGSDVSFQQATACLINEFGVFSGVELRGILGYWLLAAIKSSRISDKIRSDFQTKASAGTFSFKDFYKLTGMDLRVTGTNLTTKRPFVFSVKNSPSFPVMEAVGISMTIPLLFKPVVVQDGTNEVDGGLWVDGGTLNNLPLHVFDSDNYSGRGQQSQSSSFNTAVLGCRLVPEPTSASVPTPTNSMADFLSDLANTLLYPSADGQIMSDLEARHVVDVPCGSLGTLDFDTSSQVASDAEIKAEQAVRKWFVSPRKPLGDP